MKLSDMMRSSLPTKRISWIFDIGDLRSGHFCDLPIISQWAKNQLCYIYFSASVFECEPYRIGHVVDITSQKYVCPKRH